MSFKRDFYEVLDIYCDATSDEIKAAYYKLAKQYHPDKHKDDHLAELKFKEIANAYETLIDPIKRDEYHKTHDHNGDGFVEEKSVSKETNESRRGNNYKKEDEEFSPVAALIFLLIFFGVVFSNSCGNSREVSLGDGLVTKIHHQNSGFPAFSVFECHVLFGEIAKDSLAKNVRGGKIISSFRIKDLTSLDGTPKARLQVGEKGFVHVLKDLPILVGDSINCYRKEVVASSGSGSRYSRSFRGSSFFNSSSSRSSGRSYSRSSRGCSRCSSRGR
jgi:curved DNA-binding protein CbpA